ncbi:E3 ubiquitin-protein ligase rnf213-alpha-like isoform X2 [Acipenser ruthenus]|uniref:E3 ubiquitin-protein ligase rnf213-alpha-like isoform X2 n=1 Tax=Acipenser ruthenus TaxID=7906 RepID=UPI002740F0E4|nr:E3 ubiquitin-protein ligase rnf213-alpha-like isoform X2 [Acipenser ruthenus]
MKCLSCGHVVVEEKAKFCSECGSKLQQQAQPTDSGAAEPSSGPDVVMESGAELKVLSDPSGTSPSDSLSASNSEQANEKPSEEQKDNPRKKRKKRKKNKKKKEQEQDEESEGPASLESEQLSSDFSVVSLNENTANRQGFSSEAQGKDDAMTDTDPGAAKNELNQPTKITGEPVSDQTPNKEIASKQTDGKTVPLRRDPIKPQKESVASQGSSSADPQCQRNSEEKGDPMSGTNQREDVLGSSLLPQDPVNVAKRSVEGSVPAQDSQSSLGKTSASTSTGSDHETGHAESKENQGVNSSENSNPKKGKFNDGTKSQKNSTNSNQGNKDHNSNVAVDNNQPAKPSTTDLLQSPTKEKANTPARDSKDLQGQSKKSGSSNNNNQSKNKSEENKLSKNQKESSTTGVENMEVQQTASNQSHQYTPNQAKPVFGSQETNKEKKDGDGFQQVQGKNKNKKNKEQERMKAEAPKRMQEQQQIMPGDHLTIYFHAILSKDFNYDPEHDRIYLMCGEPLGNWKIAATELHVIKKLDKHGYLIGGHLKTSKTAISKSIPYKYAVSSKKLEYETVYKWDTSKDVVVNRCLFIKPNLINEQGEWHQYDDIICAKPSEGFTRFFTLSYWTDERKRNVKKGREIAGRFILQSIFDLLSQWNDANVKNFFYQLDIFYKTYQEPWVHENTGKRWTSLQFGEAEVKSLLKEAMVELVAPHLKKENQSGKVLMENPLKAAALVVVLCQLYGIAMNEEEMYALCTLLCLPPLPKEKLIEFCRDFKETFSGIKILKCALMQFCEVLMYKGMFPWVLLIPLLHLLNDVCQPFEPIEWNGSPLREEIWAGLEGLSYNSFRNSYCTTTNNRALLALMSEKKHLVEVDRMLARSWLCFLRLEDLQGYLALIDVDLLDILRALLYKLYTPPYNFCEICVQILRHVLNKLDDSEFSFLDASYQMACLNYGLKVLKRICDLAKNYWHYLAAMNSMELVIKLSAPKQNLLQEDMDGANTLHVNEVLSETLETMRNWIRNTFKKHFLTGSWFVDFTHEDEIKMWNSVISASFGSETFTSKWRTTHLKDFEGRLKQEPPLSQIEIYCSKNDSLAQLNPLLASCFENCALEAVQSICQDKREVRLFESLQRHDMGKFGKLVSKIIEKSWPRNVKDELLDGYDVVINHLLNWSVAKNIFQLQDPKIIDQLTDDARQLIAVSDSVLMNISEQLVCGDIQIKHLKSILQKKEDFLMLLKIKGFPDDEKCIDDKSMKTVLGWREEELEAVMSEKSWVDSLLKMCMKITEYVRVDVEELQRRHHSDIESMKLNKAVVVHLVDDIDNEEAGVVTYFQLNEEIRAMAGKIHTFKDSYILQICWQNEAKSKAITDSNTEELTPAPDIELTADNINKEIFEPCFERYKNIYKNTKEGSLTLGEVDAVFETYKSRYEALRQDLVIMSKLQHSEDKRWIGRRIQQIQQYHELYLAVESAQVIMEVKQALGLNGDFTILETLLDVTHEDFKEEKLDCIDKDIIQAKANLVGITETRRRCLVELGQRKNFVNWVKEALEDINELKVFVDLASISAGENDLDVDRVACFHDAVLGYSSMLYDLKPEADFPAFMESLKKLWKALESDKDLPKKLCDTARHLEWLKTVKESHGSVELSSLSLASAINEKGIYIISSKNLKKLSLDTALELKIPEEHEGGQEMRSYSLEDLKELQNKLMLMSGKGDQGQSEVDHFAEVFSNVHRLAVSFIDLYSAGNMLFRKWEANVYCSENNQAGVIMDFHLDKTIEEIIVDGPIVEQLPEICRKMEKCLESWWDFMNEKRSQHYYLNYYTAEQIVFLCNKLSAADVDQLEDQQVMMMLSFIKPNCTTTDVRKAWHQWNYDKLEKQPRKKQEVDLQSYIDDIRMEVDTSETSRKETYSIHNLPVVLSSAKAADKLDLVWNFYMRDMKYFLPHCLDIGTLGELLAILASMSKPVLRSLPPGLQDGRPNLIACPHSQVLTSSICIFMSSKEEQLPTYDEVLLCTAETTYEQVELFLRRCLIQGYKGKKVYSMLYADELTYEVSFKFEQLFNRLSKQSRDDYQLVIICNCDREHYYIPSAFSQYKVHVIPQEPLTNIQTYLSSHYRVPPEVATAASIFRDRMFVGVVSSKRAGVGKSLYVRRRYEDLEKTHNKDSVLKCIIRLIEPKVDENKVLQSILPLLNSSTQNKLTVFHFDITSSVQKGLSEFLFKLLVLHYLMDAEGKMWKCSNRHLYVIEILETSGEVKKQTRPGSNIPHYSFLDIFPKVFCRPPKEVLELEMGMHDSPYQVMTDPLMDDQEFRSEAFQRPFQYLKRFHTRENIDTFTYSGTEGTHVECLQLFFIYCGIVDPSWSELRNFAWFLNLQLQDCERSVFCNFNFTGDTLQGFKNFVVDFMILMAKDFATPSLSISDQSPGRQQFNFDMVTEEDLAPFRIRKKWETEPHPYIFFNDDHESMTFIGFHLQVNGNAVDAIDPSTGRVIKKNIMTPQLYEGLRLQRVPFNINFDELPREKKIEYLCHVLGVMWPMDPDETYELTTDNMLKMLAIHMRFRCGIPVIIMGETGCGKTRLIKFLCELRKCGAPMENMKLVKVHGGTTAEMIYLKVREAESISRTGKQEYGFDSVLFFDEANTTEAVSSIKEVLCDKTVEGEPLAASTGLQIVAACNPYRKHTDEMIGRLESAGLGYKVGAEETEDKLGSIPLRQLVYRVQALPPSMIPLVWDFGQLNDHTEKMYIQQIVQRVVKTIDIHVEYIPLITDVLSTSQCYMRQRKDECSFVSLRDVERCMQVFVWFYNNHERLLQELKEFMKKEKKYERRLDERNEIVWSLVMAVGVCYHACLEKKDKYRKKICAHLPKLYCPSKVLQEISLMQDLLLSGVPLGKTIARNKALKENVFMMVICIELRIPLFLVGKPGSSKSLAKTLVADAMQGQAAHSDLYKELKQIHLVSFQCSPHSTPEGIINTFKQCARFQEGKNLKEYVSVVVLDEIGLAEDSAKMPLKTLHPLLEEGCIDDEPLPHKKVGFVGISNWALDPAKMNRGIFVSRGDPDEKELLASAKGICSSEPMILTKVQGFFPGFAKAYLDICKKQGKEFFGLRDYYSLIKMVFAVTKSTNQEPTTQQIVEAVLRNFSGRDDVDAVAAFTSKVTMSTDMDNINPIELVRQNICADSQDSECRYLLVLTKNYAALQILQQTFFSDRSQPEIIFGSSFPKDQEYTQICRNINRVKICMETGQTIVLLNLQNLYESLYDALNQYYVCLGGQKYVDLGLGTHRVKCRVHKDFRLIVIEEKEVVYKQFPIPLINRLEKHYLDINTILKSDQKQIVEELRKWVDDFIAVDNQQSFAQETQVYVPSDVFIGYHSDTCASVVLQVAEKLRGDADITETKRKLLDEAKHILLSCATPDSVVRLSNSRLSKVESDQLVKEYFENQRHSSLADFVISHTELEDRGLAAFTEVTTFSRLLTASDIQKLSSEIHDIRNIVLLSLQQFDTEHSFLKKIRHFLDASVGNKILIIQTDFEEDSESANLIASAKYSAINEINKTKEGGRVFVYFITKLPRMEGGTSYIGFHGGPWKSVHIDDLRRSKDIISDITALRNLTISQLFEEKAEQPEAMEIDVETSEMTEPSENDENADSENILDTTSLVRSCVQSAVGMLRDQYEGTNRSTKRVQILLTLLAEDKELNASFLKTMKRRLYTLLARHDENSPSAKNWVFKEATNIDALQEGGTFRHTLWKRVQAMVIPFLAQVISLIDRDCNLDLLMDSNSDRLVKKLWMDIFGDVKLLDIPYTGVDKNSESKTILVQNYMKLDMGVCSTMPFSWRMKDYLEDLWVHALQQEGHTHKQFEEFFSKTPLGRYISQANEEMKNEFCHRYLQDFLLMTMNVSSQVELEFLHKALTSCLHELRIRLGIKEEVPSLPWVHSAYHQFKKRLQNFSRMITIYPEVAELLQQRNIGEGFEMDIDVYAATACIELLEPHNLKTDESCQAWLRQVKSLQIPVELVCSEEYAQLYGDRCHTLVSFVRSGWNRIYSLSLFVEHVLLGIETVSKGLLELVEEHTLKLGKCLQENSDLKSDKPFVAVINILKCCKEEASRKFFRYGQQPCPVCLGDARDPVLLPCEHIFCHACIKQWFSPAQMYCPVCKTAIQDDFEVKVSEEIRDAVQSNAHFRNRCNAFFIDVVSTVCFKDNSPPTESIIYRLLSLLLVNNDAIPFVNKDRKFHTKALSPFDDSVDKTPVVRSVVLKLLLKYSFEKVKKYLQKHLSSVERSVLLGDEDKTELYALFINCLEDSMYENAQCFTVAEQQSLLEQESNFLRHAIGNKGSSVSVEYLQEIARIRLSLDMAANFLVEPGNSGSQLQIPGGQQKSEFLKSIKQLCEGSGNDWYRIYLARKICHQQGMEFVQQLLNNMHFRWMFPDEIVQQQHDQPGQMDRYLVCGDVYRTFRDAVGKAMIECKTEGLAEACTNCNRPADNQAVYLVLALFREVTTLYGSANQLVHPKPAQYEALIEFIKNSNILGTQELKHLADSLVRNSLETLAVRPGYPSTLQTIIELTVHTAAVLLCGKDGILAPLKQLAFVPANMQNAFLPTMPEDMMAVAQQVLGPVHWYMCPNGHPCAVGECGQPMERRKCIDCGAEMGGENHRPVQGFQRIGITGDRTQRGHVLGDPQKRDSAAMLDTREISSVPFILIRFLTHMAMLLGAAQDPQSIAQIIKPVVPNPAQFLLAHLMKDLDQLTGSLGKGMDDTANTVHLLLCNLMEQHQHQWPVRYDATLSTKEKRNGWETAIVSSVITPELKKLERQLKEVNEQIRNDKRISSSPVVKILYGNPKTFLASLPQHSDVYCSTIWSCRDRISVQHLAHIVEQNDGKDTLPVLWKFLQKDAELKLVKFLPDLLDLQRDLVKKFQNVTDVMHGSIRDFIQSQQAASLREWYEKRIQIFLALWNQLRTSLATNGEIKIPEEYCSRDLKLDSDFTVLLPRRQGLGLCSTALVSYLIALHNDLVYTVEKFTQETQGYTVSPADLSDLHVIKYEVERDLMPLVLSNCQYSMERGRETLQEFDLQKIQQQVTNRFLRGKPLITFIGIPTLLNRQDRNYENIFKDVKAKLVQDSLPNAVMNALSGEFQSYSDVCEALSVVEVTLGFLAKTGVEAEMQLVKYVQDILQMGDQTSEHILKALSRCNLKHIIALWQYLTARKSECMIHLKRDPFTGICKEYKKNLDADKQRLLTGFFAQGNVDTFVLEMHEFLLLNLKNVEAADVYKPTWSLKDTLISYIERKDLDIPPELEEFFPEEILLSQCVEAWKFAVTYKQDRMQR